MSEEKRIERAMLRRQQRCMGWTLIAMFLMAVGALAAQVLFGHHAW
jgi:hypothetical protein